MIAPRHRGTDPDRAGPDHHRSHGRGRHRWVRAGLVAVVGTMLVTACGGADGRDAGGEGDAVSGELTVFATASLTDAFDAMVDAFVAEHPDIEVAVNNAGSQTLAGQIVEGAPADVFASADAVQMDVVGDAGQLAGEPTVFATNRLAIAVESGNPLDIDGLADLADPHLVVVLAAEEVPAGRYARQVLDAASVEVNPASLEQSVRAALSKVELGEADAAIVFASDLAAAAGRADEVVLPEDQNVVARYPIAVVADTSNPTAAEAFVGFVRSDAGQRILADAGFTAP